MVRCRINNYVIPPRKIPRYRCTAAVFNVRPTFIKKFLQNGNSGMSCRPTQVDKGEDKSVVVAQRVGRWTCDTKFPRAWWSMGLWWSLGGPCLCGCLLMYRMKLSVIFHDGFEYTIFCLAPFCCGTPCVLYIVHHLFST